MTTTSALAPPSTSASESSRASAVASSSGASAEPSRYTVCPGRSCPSWSAAAERAVQLDDNSAEAHASLATFKLFYEYDWSRAFLSRLERDPNWPPWIPFKPEP